MWNQMKAGLSPPVFEGDEDKTRVAGLVHTVLLASLVGLPLYALAFAFFAPGKEYRLIIMVPIFLLLLAVLPLTRRGQVHLAGALVITGAWLDLTVTAFVSGGVRAPALGGYVLTVVAAGLLLSRRAAFGFAGVSLLAALAMVYAEAIGLLPTSDLIDFPMTAWETHAGFLCAAAVLLSLATRSIDGALARAREELAKRQQAEAALRESEFKYRSFVEESTEGYDLTDEQGVVIEWNRALAEMTGVNREEALGQFLWDVQLRFSDDKSPEAHDRTKAAILQLLQTGQTPKSPMEHNYRRPDGALGVAQQTFFTIKTAQGFRIGSTARDITERKRAEEALRQAEAKYRNIFENSVGGIFQTSPAGKFFTANPALARMLGYDSPEELIAGVSDLNRGFYVQSARREEFMRQVSEYGMISNFESEVYRKDGSTIWISENAQAVRDDVAQVLHYEGTLIDITERKHAQDALHQRLAELEAVHTVSAALRTAQNLDEALPIVLDQTLAALGTDAGTIWLYHPASGELRVAVNRGWFCQLDEIPIKPGEGIAGTVFASGQAHLSAEFARDPFARPPTSGEIPAGWSGVCAPIRTGADAIGVLFVSVQLPRQIAPEQMVMLDSLAEMAGAALHRMSLFEETTRRLENLQSLHAGDIAIASSFDLRITLDILLDHITHQLKVDAADILLLHPHLQTLDYAAGRGFRTGAVEATRIRLGEGLPGRAVAERRAVQVLDAPRATAQDKPHFARWAGEGFAAYFGVPLIAKGEVKGVLEVYRRTPISPEPQWLDFLETFAAQAAIAIDNAQLFEYQQRSNLELSLAYDATIEGWSRALELRDRETEGHTLRVAEMTVQLAQAMGIRGTEIAQIRRGALLHDIGKMGVSDAILLKAGALTEEERAIMHQHPQLAHDMLLPIAYLSGALDIPYCHHEKWNGTGYPRGLKGDQIPLAARLFAIVDVWDALRSDRPYRPAWTEEKAREYIREQAGVHFDPSVVEVFSKTVAASPR